MKEIRVNVYQSLPRRRGEVIARVRYTNNLDTWHENGWYTKRPTLHRGLTKLRDGRYVVIYNGENGCYGLIITAQEALREVLKSGHMELLKTKKFKQLGEKQMAAYVEPEWAIELVQWLRDRGYTVVESGSFNPTTGRGWYSHSCEYRREHVRVRVNPGGIIVLRDPGCTLQITRPAGHGQEEFVNPNQNRLDYPHRTISDMQKCVEYFESHPTFTAEEARKHFFGEEE